MLAVTKNIVYIADMTESSEGYPKPSIDDIVLGAEMSLLTQQNVVAEYREVVEKDVAEGAARYMEFVAKLEQASSGGNAQIRSLIGGPDSASRAGLVDILAANYSTASTEVKEKIIDVATAPLLKDNFFYVQMAVAKMSNPYLIGDIIREFPLANPGADYYEEGLMKYGSLTDKGQLQAWLDRFGNSFFAATTVALHKGDHEDMIESIVIKNNLLFRGAAHITAATHDVFAELKLLKGDIRPKSEIIAHYRLDFVAIFSEMIRLESEEANWTPLRRVPEMYHP